MTINLTVGRLRLRCAAGVRPTRRIVRQALADMLRSWLAGHLCIDLFAGSGAVGITALCEGAAGCLFVERARPALRALHTNLSILQKNTSLSANSSVKIMPQPVEMFLARYTTTEEVLVWADPPWGETRWRQLLPARLQVGSGSYLVLESQRQHTRTTPLLAGTGWVMQKRRCYGNTAIELLRKE